MSNQKTLKDTGSATSLEESEDGRLRFGWRDGRKIGQSGLDHVPVSRFRAQGSEKDMPINDTCGPLFNASSPSASLQRSLESRLRARMAGSGSPLYVLTWSAVDMPAGVPILRRRASGHRTSGSGSSGWPTPRSRDHHTEGDGKRGLGFSPSLAKLTERMAGWPTPDAGAFAVGADLETHLKRVEKLKAKKINGNGAGLPLGIVSQLAGWATPNAMTGHTRGLATDPEVAARRKARGHQVNLEDQIGPTSNSSPAPTEKRGSLNPAFVRWLMGFPTEWESSAPSATPSSRK